MKAQKKILKLTMLFMAGLIMSCSITGVGSNPEAILEKDNYIYKEYLDNVHYNIELINVDKEIDSLDAVLAKNPNDEKAIIEKEAAEKSRDIFKVNLSKFVPLEVYGIIGPVWPCDLCLPSFENLKYIAILANSQVALNKSTLEVTIYNEKGELISTMDNQFNPLPGNEENVEYSNFSLVKSYSGPVSIKVFEENNEGEIILNYTLDGFIEDKV